MADFAQALREAERELHNDAALESARARVEARIRKGGRPRMGGYLWAPALAVALFSLMALTVYAVVIHPQDEVGSALVAEPPSPDVRRVLAPRPGAAHGQRGAVPELRASAQSSTTPSQRVPPSIFEVRDPWVPSPTSQPSVSPAPSASATMKKTGTGTLVAIAIGGSCNFSVDGTSHGSRSSIRLTVAVGPHTVSCTPKGGATRSQRVNVKDGKPGIASFRLK